MFSQLGELLAVTNDNYLVVSIQPISKNMIYDRQIGFIFLKVRGEK